MPNQLTNKVGPLPVWGWGLLVVGGALLFRFLRPSDTPDANVVTSENQDLNLVPDEASFPPASTPTGVTFHGIMPDGTSVDFEGIDPGLLEKILERYFDDDAPVPPTTPPGTDPTPVPPTIPTPPPTNPNYPPCPGLNGNNMTFRDPNVNPGAQGYYKLDPNWPPRYWRNDWVWNRDKQQWLISGEN